MSHISCAKHLTEEPSMENRGPAFFFQSSVFRRWSNMVPREQEGEEKAADFCSDRHSFPCYKLLYSLLDDTVIICRLDSSV
jgi:hypothetical protein